MRAVPHGGDLAEARRVAPGITEWLDLSTGISPHPYPAAFPAETLHRLPQPDALDRLLAAARTAYRVPPEADVVAAPGTQSLIALLPRLVPARTVAVVGPTYGEHRAAWAPQATVREVPDLDGTADITVLVNPNNPDGRTHDPATVRALARSAADAGRLLVVDEAFADVAPHLSVAGAPETLVLRSFGKFYGLPGLRLGFAIGSPPLVTRIAEALSAWAVSGPALHVGAAALEDTAWTTAARMRLAADRAALDAVLAAADLPVVGGTDLFRLVKTQAADVHAALARAGIWTRRFPDHPDWLRIGLPGPQLPRLAAALARATA